MSSRFFFSDRLKELEEKERKEAENKFERISAKTSSAPKRDPKQILKAYKTTERKTDPKIVEAGLPKIKDEWTPLEYLRHFSMERKKIEMDRYINKLSVISRKILNYCFALDFS